MIVVCFVGCVGCFFFECEMEQPMMTGMTCLCPVWLVDDCLLFWCWLGRRRIRRPRRTETE